MKITMEMECNNSSFDEDGCYEIVHILMKLKENMLCNWGQDEFIMKDSNGNTVGKAIITDV